MATQLVEDLLTSNEVEALIRACSKRAPTGRRNRALIATMWRSGLRVSEALALTPKDVDLAEGRITIQNGKGGRRRVVGLDMGTCLIIDQWLVSRRKLGVGSRAPLFCTLTGGRIDPSYVRHMLPRIARRAGVEKRVHAHGLRHAFAIDMARSGTPLFLIRDSLGHKSVSTTQTYLSRVGGHEVVETMRDRDWSMPASSRRSAREHQAKTRGCRADTHQ